MARLRNKLVGTGPGAGDHNADTNVLAVTKNLPLFIERVERILDGQVCARVLCFCAFVCAHARVA